jgi:hypothetical protein
MLFVYNYTRDVSGAQITCALEGQRALYNLKTS